MQIHVQRKALLAAMRLVGQVVPGRSPKPVLMCVRLEATTDKLLVHGTDIDTYVVYEVGQVTVDAPGDMTVMASLLEQILQMARSETLVFISTEAGCQIVEADAKYNLYGIDPQTFPAAPVVGDEFDAVMPLEEFRAGVRMTEFAASKHESRYAINGVLLKIGKGHALLVATDGRRMACRPVKDESEMEAKGIVPPKAMRVLSAVAADGGVAIKVKVCKSLALFVCGPLVMTTNLVAGNFPDYESIIPKVCKAKLVLNTSSILSAVRRVSLMKPDTESGIAMSLSSGSLAFMAKAPKQVLGEVVVPVEYEGDGIDVWFRPEHVTDALRVIGSDTFDLELNGPDSPVLIRGPKDYVYVFMPLSIA